MAGSAAQRELQMASVPIGPATLASPVGMAPMPPPDPADAGWPSMLFDATNPIFDTITTLNSTEAISLIHVFATNPGPPPAWAGVSMNCLGIAPGPPGPGGADVIYGNKNNLHRWLMMLPNTENENGGNSGSNFTMHRYADDGSDLDFPDGFFKIFRSTGQVWFREGIMLGETGSLNSIIHFQVLPTNAANDAAAAAAGLQIGDVYRNGSQLMVRAT